MNYFTPGFFRSANPFPVVRFLTLSWFLFGVIPAAVSQDLRTARTSSHYTYLFKLTAEQYKQCYRKNAYFDSLPNYLASPVDSFPTDSGLKKNLKPGVYVTMDVRENFLDYEIIPVTTFETVMYNNGHDLVLFFFDKASGKPLSQAEIELNGKKVPFDSSCKSYVLPYSKKTGFLSVKFNNEVTYSCVSYSKGYYTFYRRVKTKARSLFGKVGLPFARFYYRLRYSGPSQELVKTSYRYDPRPKYTGYIAFNKPKYLPRDTVKVKAYFLKHKTKALTRDVKVFMYKKNHWENRKQVTWLHAASKGAYDFQTVLKDSLELNTWYTLYFIDKKNGDWIMGRDFFLEDYQLDETHYEFRSEKKDYRTGEPLTFFATGKDANNLNLLDARLSITARTKEIRNYFSDTVFVPNTLWKHEQKLDPIGETKIMLPDSVLPSAAITLELEVIFNNSNNESHDTTLTLTYEGRKAYIRVRYEGDTLTAEKIIDGKSVPGKGTLSRKKTNSHTEKKEIVFPYSEVPDNTCKQYSFFSGELIESFDLSDQSSRMYCYTQRTADSVFISLSNPRHLQVQYSIYKNGKEEVERGTTFELERRIEDKTAANYMLYYYYMWYGEAVSESRSILFFKDLLHIDLDQPARIYPGQTTKVKIRVTDMQSHAVEGVNITAGAINNQFHSGIAGVPYLGKSVKNLECANNFALTDRKFKGQKLLDEKWRKRFSLDTMAFYRLIYPPNGLYCHWDSIGTGNAQVSPFIYAKGYQLPVFLIYIDHEPVYYYNATNAVQYVFPTVPGYHTLTLRSRENIYTIDSVYLKKGFKLDLSFDAEHPPARVVVGKAESHFSDYEKSSAANSALVIHRSYYDKSTIVWQDDKVFRFSDYDNNYVATLFGFRRDTVHYFTDNFRTSFLYEPGYEYTLYKGLIKMRAAYFPIEHELPSRISQRLPGLRAVLLPPLKPAKFNAMKKYYTYNPSRTADGNGTLSFEYTGDSLISLARVENEDDHTHRFVDGATRNIRDLRPGNYSLLLITPSRYYLSRSFITVKGDGTTFMRFGDGQYTKIPDNDTHFLSAWDTIIPARIYGEPETGMVGKASYNIYTGNGGAIKVEITDRNNKEPIPFANVVLYRDQVQVATGTADFDGISIIKPLPAGRYRAKVVYVGYGTQEIRDLIVIAGRVVYVPVALYNEGVELQSVDVVEYKVPLIDPTTVSGGTIDRESFVHMADKSLNSVVSTQAGVYQQESYYDINIRGSRSSSSTMFVDGERMIGTSGLPAQYANVFIPESQPGETAPQANVLRNVFADYAYWQPNLITDEKGEASFSVTFPQNITSWKAFALAMNDHRQSGAAYKETRAFKNIMVNLALPRFLVEGDSAYAIGKIMNYNSAPAKVKSVVKIMNEKISEKDTTIRTAVIDSIFLHTDKTDSLKVSYMANVLSGGKDGEERIIPVFPLGTQETKGTLYTLNGDTSIEIETGDHTSQVYIAGNILDLMVKQLEELEKYPYWCMEQTASKLNGLLMQKSIYKELKMPFKKEKEIEALLHKLEKGQKENGSWGWWEDSPENTWMTSYVARIVSKAVKEGYSFPNKEKALRYLAWNMHVLKGKDLLAVLNTLSEMKLAIPYDEYFKKLGNDSLNLYQKLLMIKILQENDLPYSTSVIEKEKKQTALGSYYWGKEAYDWSNNDLMITLLVYTILEKQNADHPYLPHIRNYFLEKRRDNQWRNTIETASVLETILPALLKNTDAKETSSVSFEGAESKTITTFPYSGSIGGKNQKFTMRKKGAGPVFLTIYHEEWNRKPEKKTDLYEISAHYEVKGKKTNLLQGGVPAELVVEVNAKKKGDYVMLEIPIPAGCSYDDNRYNTNPLEVHREYFKNKTSLFCEYLPIGNHVFRIKLQPRFSGVYTMNPVTAELMYFPVLYGRNGIEKINIK